MYMTGAYVKEGEFPDGIICLDCHVVIPTGNMYFMRPEGVMGDGTPYEELICAFCAADATLAHLV